MRRAVAPLIAVLAGVSALAQTPGPRFRRDVDGVRLRENADVAPSGGVDDISRIAGGIALAPGRYQLRAADMDRGGTRGSVHFDLDVPDFGKGPLALGGVVLTATPDNAPTSGSDQRWKQQLPGPPTTMRTFAAGDRLALFTEIYDNAGKPGDAVEVTTTITSAAGETPMMRVDSVTARSGKEKSAATAYAEVVPLADVRPGRYVLGIDVRRTANGTHHVLRQIPFAVR